MISTLNAVAIEPPHGEGSVLPAEHSDIEAHDSAAYDVASDRV
jgi:hypothetical protein